MISHTKLLLILLSALIVIYCFLGGVVGTASVGDEVYRDLSIFTDILHKIRNEYVETPQMETAVRGAMQGMLESLDPYSSYVDEATFRELNARRRNGKADPGLILSKRYGYIYVVSTVPGSSAHRQGLRTADLVESIEGRPTASMSLWEAESRLLGEEGSEVEMRVIRWRRAEPASISLKRTRPQTIGNTASWPEAGIGLLTVSHFEKGASEQLRQQLKSLKSKGLKGLIVDLRGVAQGSLEEALKTASFFLPKGSAVYSLRHRGKSAAEGRTFGDPLLDSAPVMLLINRGTSGAAEVFVAALRDHDRAETVGERTNGQGGVQELFRLQDGSALILSTQWIFRSSGDPIQGKSQKNWGVSPDLRWPSQDFESSFYYENVPDDGNVAELDDDFYRRLAAAIEEEQLRKASEKIRAKLLNKKAA